MNIESYIRKSNISPSLPEKHAALPEHSSYRPISVANDIGVSPEYGLLLAVSHLDALESDHWPSIARDVRDRHNAQLQPTSLPRSAPSDVTVVPQQPERVDEAGLFSGHQQHNIRSPEPLSTAAEPIAILFLSAARVPLLRTTFRSTIDS